MKFQPLSTDPHSECLRLLLAQVCVRLLRLLRRPLLYPGVLPPDLLYWATPITQGDPSTPTSSSLPSVSGTTRRSLSTPPPRISEMGRGPTLASFFSSCPGDTLLRPPITTWRLRWRSRRVVGMGDRGVEDQGMGAEAGGRRRVSCRRPDTETGPAGGTRSSIPSNSHSPDRYDSHFNRSIKHP